MKNKIRIFEPINGINLKSIQAELKILGSNKQLGVQYISCKNNKTGGNYIS